VFNATFNNISVISWRQFYWRRKPEDPEKTTDLSQVNDKHNGAHLAPKNTTQKTKKMINTDPTKNTRQKTKKMSNMDLTKKYNTEN
jgi:hypothetical protein